MKELTLYNIVDFNPENGQIPCLLLSKLHIGDTKLVEALRYEP